MAHPAEDARAPAGERPQLQRVISRPMLTVFVLGDILGAGIYATVGVVAGEVGGGIWASFLLAFFLAFLTAGSYAELVTKYPRAAGAALYVHKAFGLPFVTFLIAVVVMASGITSASTSSLAFAGDYLSVFLPFEGIQIPGALLFIALLGVINFRGISESIKVNLGLTAIEVTGLLIIIFIGIVTLATGEGQPARAFEFSGDSVPLAILGGAALSFFSFVGFEDSVNVAEEARDPRRIYPLALFVGLGLAGLIYLAVTFTASMVVDSTQLAESSGPLLEVVRQGTVPIPPRLFSFMALVAVSNTALINLIMASRLLYGLSNQGITPGVFARVHAGRRTPYISIIFVSLIAYALILTSGADLGTLAQTTVLLLLLVFALVNCCVLVLRRDAVDAVHFKVPTVVPVLGAITCLGLLTQQEGAIWIRAAILILIGVVLYGINRVVAGRVGTIRAEELEG